MAVLVQGRESLNKKHIYSINLKDLSKLSCSIEFGSSSSITNILQLF